MALSMSRIFLGGDHKPYSISSPFCLPNVRGVIKSPKEWTWARLNGYDSYAGGLILLLNVSRGEYYDCEKKLSG